MSEASNSPSANRPGIPPPPELSLLEDLKIWVPLCLLVVLIIAVLFKVLVPPAPPRVIRFAAGAKGGAYESFARRYQAALAELGFELQILETRGSIENLQKLRGDQVEVALVQGGASLLDEEASESLESLASVFYEPCWVFHRGPVVLEDPRDLRELRIAIGPEGSGTRVVALRLLNYNAIAFDEGRHLPLSGREAADALKSGRIDAVFMVASPSSLLCKELLVTSGVHLMDFRRQQAYKARDPFLSAVTLSEGICDLERNIPERVTRLVAPTANLVWRKNAHSALPYLMLSAAERVHRDGGLLETPREFPSALNLDLPLNETARRYLRSGPSILHRMLPFWLADLLDRLKIMLLPVLTLLIPLIKIAPPVYRWRIRSKIFRWYRVLREIDQDLMDEKIHDAPSYYASRLDGLERELDKVQVPLSYMEEFYNLRVHIGLVRQLIEAFLREQSGKTAGSPPLADQTGTAIDGTLNPSR